MIPYPTTPCIRWHLFIGSDGYGRVNRKEFTHPHLAHRWVWEQAHGPIPPGMVVMHLCDNRACVRLDHLQLGTQGENLKMAYGRGMKVRGGALNPPPPPIKRGEDHPRHVVTEELVHEIRASTETSTVWAERLGVHRSCIKAIRARRTWKHV